MLANQYAERHYKLAHICARLDDKEAIREFRNEISAYPFRPLYYYYYLLSTSAGRNRYDAARRVHEAVKGATSRVA